MSNPLKHTPPKYEQSRTLEANFERFFDWGLGLRKPLSQISEIGERLGLGVRRHPIGFIVVYLSQHSEGLATISIHGEARADIFPNDAEINEDIHCHGFDFFSGVVSGELVNTRHYPDWSQTAAEGDGYVGYESNVDVLGNNVIVQATDAVIVVPRSEPDELGRGGTYTMTPRTDFHSVSSNIGAVTIFCKTPTYYGNEGRALVLRKPNILSPPEVY